MRTGHSLSPGDLEIVASAVRKLPRDEDLDEFVRLAVRCVLANPTPVALPPPSYAR